jgi:hypothetical protein
MRKYMNRKSNELQSFDNASSIIYDTSVASLFSSARFIIDIIKMNNKSQPYINLNEKEGTERVEPKKRSELICKKETI